MTTLYSLAPGTWVAAHFLSGGITRAIGAIIMAMLLLGANFFPFAGDCCATIH